MSKVSKTYRSVSTTPVPTTVNMEGFAAFEKDPKSQLLQMLLTGTLGNTFYADASKMQNEAEEVISMGVKNFPLFTAKAAVYARNEGFMRSMPIITMAHLALTKFVYDSNFPEMFDQVMLTPNDLADFMEVFYAKKKNLSGRRWKKIVGHWLQQMTPYWVIKYGSESANGFTLRNLMLTVHPRGVNPDLASYIVHGTMPEGNTDYMNQIAAFELFKNAKTDAEAMNYANVGRLPFEVVTSLAGKFPKIWESVALNGTIQNTMKNLVTLQKHGVLEKYKKEIYARMTFGESIQKAKLLPYQVFNAFKKCQQENLPVWVLDMLRIMFEQSIVNVVVPSGKTIIAVDHSGSMTQPVYEARGKNEVVSNRRPFEDALLLAVTVAKASGGDFILFDTSLEKVNISKVDSVLTQADNLKNHTGGGTTTSLVVTYMEEQAKKDILYDNVWLFTDAQQNNRGNDSEGFFTFMDALAKYRKTRNRNVKLFEINIGPYAKSGSLAPEGGLNWLGLGASLNMIDTFTQAVKVNSSMVKLIEE